MWIKLLGLVISMTIFLVIDFFWIGVFGKTFIQKQAGHLMRPNPKWLAAVVFYIIYIVGLSYFVIWPAFAKHAIWQGFGRGALFGLVTYGTYDLTNYAVAKDWPLPMTIVDMIWGTFLTAFTSLLSVLILQLF